ncbi:DpnD/PcfM family protein [Treponema sp. UBA753]|uniref:DpnD/PcfM family protein n=2 Tax=Treponema TaxID=157 RepID=UPI0025DC8FCE|nr:DpnD/PcfM family protein [Treponema sp. UBA753]
MKSYKIDICEYYGKTVEIEAETEEEAFKKLIKEYMTGKIDIGEDDYKGTEFYPPECFSNPVSELIQTLVSILQLNGVFVRNLFRGNVLRNSMNQKTLYTKDENTFLLFVEDWMHNIPDLVSNLLQHDNDMRIRIDTFLLSLVTGGLKEFNSIVQDKETRISYGIRDTDNIQNWLSFGLKNIVPYSEKAVGLMESIVLVN